MTREEAVKALERAEDYAGIHYVNGVEDPYISPYLLKAIDFAVASLRKQEERRWIPVAERLPEVVLTHRRRRSIIKKSIRVLCVCVQNSGKSMVKEGYCEWYNDYPEPRWKIPGTIGSVTHWMPIPQPPKEDCK